MPLTSARLVAVFAGFVVSAAAVAHARPDPEPQPAPAPPTPPASKADPADKAESVLGGPKVTVRKERPTLVERDSEGKLKRLEDRPEVVAAGMLELSGEPKKAVQKVLDEHGAVVAKVLNEHQGLFLQIQQARQSGDMKGGMAHIRELHQKAPQLWEPPLIDQLSKAMPVEKAVQLRSLVHEYLLALAAEGGPESAPRPRPAPGGGEGGAMTGGEGGSMMQEGMTGGGGGMSSPTPAPTLLDDPQVARRIENGLVVRELARSLKTLTEMRREKTEQLLAGLNLTAEQDAKVRAMIRETGEKAKGGQPSRDEHKALIEKIRLQLTPEQNIRLNENLKNR